MVLKNQNQKLADFEDAVHGVWEVNESDLHRQRLPYATRPEYKDLRDAIGCRARARSKLNVSLRIFPQSRERLGVFRTWQNEENFFKRPVLSQRIAWPILLLVVDREPRDRQTETVDVRVNCSRVI
jgi:hypothetical protein